MTITEANAVNKVLNWIISNTHQQVDAETVEAAALLAGKAHRALFAGLDPEAVRNALRSGT